MFKTSQQFQFISDYIFMICFNSVSQVYWTNIKPNELFNKIRNVLNNNSRIDLKVSKGKGFLRIHNCSENEH